MGKLQRLLLPPGSEAFCGIATYQGIPDEVRNYLFTFCNFDYMGASEYEFGAIPKSLNNIFLTKKDRVWVEKEVSGVAFIFIVQKDKAEDYFREVQGWMETNFDAHGEYSGLKDLKENKPSKIIGWLDLDKHVLFFRRSKEGKLMAYKFFQLLCLHE